MTIDLTCMCGSGKQKRALFDARGFFLTYACPDCRERKLRGFRAEVLADHPSRPDRVWNRIADPTREQIIDLALA